MGSKLKAFLEFLLMLVLLGIDQATKWWAQMHDMAIYNTGGVFGVLPSKVWVVFLPVILAFLVYEWWHTRAGLEKLGMGMLIVGGIGNIIDRVIFGAVRDFIYYSYFGVYGNVADIVLVVGVGLIMIAKFKW